MSISKAGALLALLLCVGCQSRPAHVETEDSPPLVGVVWVWTALAGPDALEVGRPGRYVLELRDDGSYFVRADCNTGGGSYTTEGNRLTLEPGPMTGAACGPDSHDARFASLLARVVSFRREGDRLVLQLGGGEGSLEFDAMKPTDLAGTSWIVQGYNNGKGGVTSVAPGATLDATFTESGTVVGSSGCNGYTAGYEIDGQEITIGPAASTRKLCSAEGVMEQEAAYLAALAGAKKWEIRGERLQLRRADGALTVDLVSAVTGTVTYRTRRALPPNAEIKVSLLDVSRADAPATVIGEQVIRASGRQVPFAFQIAFDPAAIDPRHTYGVRATITVDGKLIYTSTSHYPVITRESPRWDVEIEVEPVGS